MTAMWRRNARIGAVAAVAAFLALGGGGAGWAYWTSQATVQVPAAAADLTVAPTGFESLAKSFTNDSLVHTGSVTVTNTTSARSTQRAAVTLTLSATGQPPALLQNFAIVMWASTAANPCTAAAAPGTALVTGTWGATSAWTTPAGQGFTVGEARVYCVRTTAASREAVASASGSASFTPQITGSIALGSFSGAAVQTANQSTSQIFPTAALPDAPTRFWWIRSLAGSSTVPNYCASLSGTAPTAGGPVNASWCKTSRAANQGWQILSVPNRPLYVTIASRPNVGFLMTGDTAVRTQPPSGAAAQNWQLQNTPSGVQIVNDASGLCWTVPSGAAENVGQITLAPCANVRSQWFDVSLQLSPPDCAYSSGGTGNYTVTVYGAQSDVVLQLRIGGTVTFTSQRSNGTHVILIPRTSVPAGTSTMDILESGTTVAYGSITKGSSTSTFNNSCSFSEMTL